MSRLIDADAIQEILDYLDTVLHPIVSPENWNVYAELHDMISMLPSAQPEIIKCKDCKWWGAERFCENSDSPCFQNGCTHGNWFCADGEKVSE